MATIEHDIQAACVRWFRLQYPHRALNLFAVPNGAARSRWEAGIKKAEGMTAGVADMLLLVPSPQYHGLALEFKRPKTATGDKTYQSPEQKAWQQAVEAQGYRYEVVRSFDEFKTLIDEYLTVSDHAV